MVYYKMYYYGYLSSSGIRKRKISVWLTVTPQERINP